MYIKPKTHFVGVPAPGGALLILLPVFFEELLLFFLLILSSADVSAFQLMLELKDQPEPVYFIEGKFALHSLKQLFDRFISHSIA